MKDQVPLRDSPEKFRKTHANARKDNGLGFPKLLMRLARLAGFDGAAGKISPDRRIELRNRRIHVKV